MGGKKAESAVSEHALRRVSRSAETGFVLDALEQALYDYDRRPFLHRLVHHSDCGSQHVLKCTSFRPDRA